MDDEPVLRYWTLHGPAGEVATCEVVRTPNGLEVRCEWTGQSEQAKVPRAAAIDAMSDALTLAEAWKASYVAEGWIPRGTRGSTPDS
jgi:hypothetical protein